LLNSDVERERVIIDDNSSHKNNQYRVSGFHFIKGVSPRCPFHCIRRQI
jgi:hypothetical protein